jgi:hypothetical protein
MSDDPELRLPPMPLPILKKIQEIETWTRKALADCGFPGFERLDNWKALEAMRTALIADLDVRIGYFETLKDYEWDWTGDILSHATASVLACFPNSLYVKEADDGAAEYEGNSQFLDALIHTGREYAVERRLATESSKPVAAAEGKKVQRVSQTEIERRAKLLAEYKSATGNPSDRKIYLGNSGIHKPQLSEWKSGTLPVESATTQNFERFLAAKKRPIPRLKRPKK